MRIGLVIFRADPSRGGAERYTHELATELARRGHEISLIAWQHPPTVAPQAFRRVQVNVAGLTRAQRYRSFVDATHRLLDEHGFDVLHAMLPVRKCHVYEPHAGFEQLNQLRGGIARRWLNRLDPKRHLQATIERQMLQQAPLPIVVCLSERSRREARDALGLAESVVLRHGVDLSRFTPAGSNARNSTRRELGLRPEEVVFGLVGQDLHRKGLDFAAEAFENRPGAALLVVGGDARTFRKLIRGRVNRAVHVPSTPEVPRLISAMDVLLLPSRHEPFGLVAIEAMACGVPAIVSDRCGACEVLRDGQDGLVVNIDQGPDELARAMLRLLDDEVRARFSASCLARREELAYGRRIDELERLYQRVRGA
jgi:UDP-glucose:(heptosyl)LPS alpha-1,3-glucosyltransferase